VSGRFASIPLEAPFRLGIWEDTARIIREMPLTGTGFNTFGVASPYYQTTDLSLHFAEAHNDYLQLASEGGLFLLIVAASVLVVFCRQIARRLGARADDVETAWTRVGAVAGLVAVAAQSLVEFGLQVPANASLLMAVAALAAHEPRPRRMAHVRPPATG
jgi:O-antigen ligase